MKMLSFSLNPREHFSRMAWFQSLGRDAVLGQIVMVICNSNVLGVHVDKGRQGWGLCDGNLA